MKENLTSTPRLEPFKVNNSDQKLRDKNNNTIKNKNCLFNSDLSPLVLQKRQVVFEQNRYQLSQFVLRKNFELSNKKSQENLPKIQENPTNLPNNLKSKTRDLLKNLCMNFKQDDDKEPITIKDTINEPRENDDIIELIDDGSQLKLLDSFGKNNKTIVIDSPEASVHSKPNSKKDKSMLVLKNSTKFLKENKEKSTKNKHFY